MKPDVPASLFKSEPERSKRPPRILIGSDRGALRAFVLREVRDQAIAWPERRAILIVPEQTKLDVERELLSLAGPQAIMMTEILSFRRLAWRLLGEAGRAPRRLLSPLGRGLLVHRALGDETDTLRVFAGLSGRPGFIRQLVDVMGDLRRYQIDGEALSLLSSQIEDLVLRNKLTELAAIMRRYDQLRAQSGLQDPEDELIALAELLNRLPDDRSAVWPWPLDHLQWIGQTDVWVTGFGETRDFTPQEDAILTALARVCDSLTMTAAADFAPADEQAAEIGPPAFQIARRVVWRKLAADPAWRVERVPASGSPVQTFLLPYLERSSQPESTAEVPLRLVSADSADDELSWVAGEIRRLALSQGYRFGDIALALCDDSLLPRLSACCREYEVPLFVDDSLPLTASPLLQFLTGMMDLELSGWSRDAVLRTLRSGLTPLTEDEIDRLENFCLKFGLFRRDRLFDDRRFRRGSRLKPTVSADPDTEADTRTDPDAADPAVSDSAEILPPEALRDLALAELRSFLRSFARRLTFAERSELLRAFLDAYGVQERLQVMIRRFAGIGATEAALNLARSWNELLALLDETVTLAGTVPVDLRTYREELLAGMAAAPGQPIPYAIDQVSVGDLRRAMLRKPRVLFIIGASADRFLPPPPPEGLLKDPERRAISELLPRALPSHLRNQALADAFIRHALMTAPSERLILTCSDPVWSADFQDLALKVPQALLRLKTKPERTDARLAAPLPAWRHNRAGRGERLLSVDRLTEEERIWLPSAAVLSVSQLERYAECPFRHFGERVLRLAKRPEYGPDAAQTGVLLHAVMELAMRAWMAEGPARADHHWRGKALAERVSAWVEQAAPAADIDLTQPGLRTQVHQRLVRSISLLVASLARQLKKVDSFQPAVLEWTFGPEQGNALWLPPATPGDPSGATALRGVIDRVDTGGSCFRVIDYKSSDQSWNLDAVYAGLSLQLPVYLAAFAAAHPELQPNNAAFQRLYPPYGDGSADPMDNPAGDDERLDSELKPKLSKLSPDVLQALCAHSLKQAGISAGKLRGGDFSVRPSRLPRRPAPCTTCQYLAVCGFDQALDRFQMPPRLDRQVQPSGRLESRKNAIRRLFGAGRGQDDPAD